MRGIRAIHRCFLWITLGIMVMSSCVVGAETSVSYVPGDILIRLHPTVNADASGFIHALIRDIPAKLLTVQTVYPAHAELTGVYKLQFDQTTDIPAICACLNRDPAVIYAEPNMIARPQAVPNDPYYTSSGAWGQAYADMWGVHAINVEDAWDTTQGEGVVVAILDTGVDYGHEDWFNDANDNGVLDAGEQYNIWINPGEDLNSNGVIDPGEYDGIDNDSNGYVDDLMGYDIIYGDGEPTDLHGHGSHCAGIVSAVADNSIGLAGVAPQSKVMIVKALDDQGFGPADEIAEGFIYAADNGANIISNSWLSDFSQTMADAIDYAQDKGCVITAAAGNSAQSAVPILPAGHPGVITAAGIDFNMRPATFTNYGSVVDVCAPAVNILSIRAEGTDFWNDGNHFVPHLDPDARYFRHIGTSAACPMTSGVVALLMSASDSSLSSTILRRTLTRSANEIVSTEHYIGTGLLDAVNALATVDTITGIAAEITSPANDQEPISGDMPLQVYGTAAGDSYTLELGVGYYPTSWTTVATGESVTDGLLGQLDLTTYTGPCHLRLRVVDGVLTGDEHMVFHVEHSPPEPCDTTGASIEMPSDNFYPGDTCSCTLTVCNAETSSLTGYPLFVILDIAGAYFFAPGFSEFEYYERTFAVGETEIAVLQEFSWPSGVGSAGTFYWYAAFTDPAISTLFGELGTFSFQWSE